VAAPDPVPKAKLVKRDFVDSCEPDDLVYFLLNVGDGDTQLVLLPQGADGTRRALVVDVGTREKLPALLEALEETPLLPPTDGLFCLVVATHPHLDHIGGMAQFLDRFHSLVGELWEPGYYSTSPAYVKMMNAIEEHGIRVSQPASGMSTFFGKTRVQVLSPAIALRNRFDTYGIDINNASISLKLDFPATRVVDVSAEERRYAPLSGRTRRLILGGDAQTLSWAHVLGDFPKLEADASPIARRLKLALGSSPLSADVLKISHHGSKHGINLELIEAIDPTVSLFSSVGGAGEFGFPHTVAQECVREALESTTSGQRRSRDWKLGIHYTGGTDSGGAPLGSIALVIPSTGNRVDVWRFGDGPREPVDLDRARLFKD
jgi:beta-lactamase superfamily II metal-dependent hydrolase